MSKTKLNREYACFLKDLHNAASSIQQAERNGINLVAACMKEGMWYESHSLASLLPLKPVTNLDYRMQLRSQRILIPLEVRAGWEHPKDGTEAGREDLLNVRPSKQGRD